MTLPLFTLRHFRVFPVIVLSALLAGVSASCTAHTQDSTTSLDTFAGKIPGTQDDSIFAERIRVAKEKGFAKLPIGERVVAMGKLFLGTPYVAATLDGDSVHENLVVNLHGLDCVTFYENALAMARVIAAIPNPTRKDYEAELERLRYRDGANRGYHTRLHYSTDYFADAAKKHLLIPETQKVGGTAAVLDTRTIDFMTTHRASYKALATNDTSFAGIVRMEQALKAQGGYYYIPKEKIAQIESGIQTGDILGITTNIAGLDCSHTGIAIKMPDGRIHFMHASSLEHKVIISPEPLADYLTHSSHQTGIIVNRPVEVAAH